MTCCYTLSLVTAVRRFPSKHAVATDKEDVAKLNLIDMNEQKVYISYDLNMKIHTNYKKTTLVFTTGAFH